uniref:Uncharacterized protein n=1 Tax=Halalkalibacterium halodurans TaxID=86665 RepID=A0A0M0KED8_ALKHA
MVSARKWALEGDEMRSVNKIKAAPIHHKGGIFYEDVRALFPLNAIATIAQQTFIPLLKYSLIGLSIQKL